MEISILPILVTAVGGFFLIKLKAFFILHPVRTVKRIMASVHSIETLKALCLALAGTLGVGNIFGVSVGLMIGGAGSVFWLFVSSIFSSVTKYAEVTVTSDNLTHGDDVTRGSMICVLRNTLGGLGLGLSKVYALFCIVLALFMGAAMQSMTVIELSGEIFNTPPHFVGVFLVVLVLFAILGGAGLIEKITLFLIPVSTVVYIILCLVTIFCNLTNLPKVLEVIIEEAFTFRGATGGFFAALMSKQVKEGYSRGILSNEAGAGTSSFAHSRSGIMHPSTRGLFGIVEVFFDTGVLCMLTALAILSSGASLEGARSAMSLVLSSVGTPLGAASGMLLLLCCFTFAYSTVICWYYYGTVSVREFFGKRATPLFLPVFCLFVFFGGFLGEGLLVSVTDLSLLVLSVLTSFALIKNSDRIRTLSESGGLIDKSFPSLGLKETDSRKNGNSG